jgi:hypothetical protein
MMKARLVKIAKANELFGEVQSNLELYRKGDFNFLASDTRNYLEIDLEIDEKKLAAITCSEKDDREVQNCMAILDAMGSLTPYLARDERVWVYLTHTLLLDYSRKRWPVPVDDDKAVKHILTHFFVVGARGVERDNAASRLWWMAYLCARVEDLSLEEALTCLLYQYDVRANIIERPTTAQSVAVFSAILKILSESYKEDKRLFNREYFRRVMKKLNLKGGVTLLAALDKDTVEDIIQKCI